MQAIFFAIGLASDESWPNPLGQARADDRAADQVNEQSLMAYKADRKPREATTLEALARAAASPLRPFSLTSLHSFTPLSHIYPLHR